MKKLFLFLAMASTTMFVSCGSDDSDGGSKVTSITLAASATTIDLGQPVTLTVTDNNGDAVTSGVIFYDGTTVITSPYTPTTAGTHSLTAKYEDLTSPAVVVTVNVVANNSFVINNVNYETPLALFQYLGIAEVSEGTYVIGWALNPFLEVEEAGEFTYPNDLYVYAAYPIEPTGTDPETGDPTFTIELPTNGTFTFDPDLTAPMTVFDAQVFADSETAYLPTVAADRAALIEDITLEIPTLDLESEVTDLETTYSISLTNGTTIEGNYSGETGVYGLPQQARSAKAKSISSFNAKTQNVFKSVKKADIKK